MDNVREKLVELLCRAHHNASCVIGYDGSEGEALEEEARYLIANGVTMQEWIPVTERLPDLYVPVLVYLPSNKPLPTVTKGYLTKSDTWRVGRFDREKGKITHWMPLPSVPKPQLPK